MRAGLSDAALAGLAARHGVRRMAAGMGQLLKPFGGKIPRKLIIAPQDIRTADPTIAADIYAGHLTFAGKRLETHGRSPFELEPPSEAFAAELHGFGWLRHLRAADSSLAKANARALVLDWIAGRKIALKGVAARPEVTARRMMSWLSQTPLLLDGADAPFYRSFVRALAGDAARLRRARSAAPPTELKLMIQVALTHYALSSAEADTELREAATQLCDLLDAQIRSDGGHVSRNPDVVLNLLLDILPLKLAFLWRRIQTPQPIVAAIDRMMPMLRMMRHADGALGLFNGMGATRADFVAAVLAQDDTMAPAPSNAPYTGYQRLERSGSVLIVDAAPPPRPPLASKAHAAPLAFEFSAEGQRIVMNCGAPPSHRPEMALYARLTAAHSTLVAEDANVGRFARTAAMTRLVGAQLIGGARKVGLRRTESDEGIFVELDHDGYRGLGIRHERRLALAADGLSLEGEDALVRARPKRDIAYALRFHLSPLVKPLLAADGMTVSLALPGRPDWIFEAGGATIALEETIIFASTEGMRRSEQIVVAADTKETDRIAWAFRRADA